MRARSRYVADERAAAPLWIFIRLVIRPSSLSVLVVLRAVVAILGVRSSGVLRADHPVADDASVPTLPASIVQPRRLVFDSPRSRSPRSFI